MSKTANALENIRNAIMSDPDVILEDRAVMKALVAANDKNLGGNVIDLRGVAMERLEERFDRLEDTHRNVIAAAYENLAGTNQVQRAVLSLMEPGEFDDFLALLNGDVASIMKVDRMMLCLESAHADESAAAPQHDSVRIFAPGFLLDYQTDGRNFASRFITLRQNSEASPAFYGDKAQWIQSEALITLDLGPGNRPGMLAIGSEDPHRFHPNQGTDLLTFFGGVFERIMRRWLA